MDHTREGPSDSSSILSRSRVRLSSLRRFASQEHHNDKTPLLTLRLSSPSFLNTLVEDETQFSLYTIKTIGNFTTVMRSDPWDGTTKTADIRWPENAAALKGKGKKSGGVQVQMRGQRWVDEGPFLRAGSSSSPRKFSIPNYSQSLKWRQIGTAYWCTCPSVKGPIAILEPAADSLPPQLQIYETLRDKYDGRQMSDHQGVSILLLDYILITSLLLVTDVREAMQLGREDQSDLTDTPTENSAPFETAGPCPTPGIPITSMSQWRKIMYGEPIYPKRHARSNSSESSPVGPTSHDNPANVMRGAPIYPNLSSTINFDSSSDSDPDNEILSSEPSPDSVPPTSPPTRYLDATASLSQEYFDQSLNSDHRYQWDDEVQHQPPILPPLALIRSHQSRTIGPAPISAYPYQSRPSSASSALRPRSTPPQSQDHQPPPPLPNIRSARSPSLPTTLLNRTTPARPRPLPRPPASTSAPTVRHAYSQQRLSPTAQSDKYGSRGLPSPPTPVSNIYPLGAAVDAGPAHLSQTLLHPPHARYPHVQFIAPFQSSKTPAENDLLSWIRERPGAAHSTPDAPPYNVPPPAYNTINFDE